jgi:hypothetical protein
MMFLTRNARLIILNIIIPINSCIISSLKDSLISGITDGEDSFTYFLLYNSNNFRFRYILTHKWEANKYVLEHIMNIFSENLAKGVWFLILLIMYENLEQMVQKIVKVYFLILMNLV